MTVQAGTCHRCLLQRTSSADVQFTKKQTGRMFKLDPPSRAVIC